MKLLTAPIADVTLIERRIAGNAGSAGNNHKEMETKTYENAAKDIGAIGHKEAFTYYPKITKEAYTQAFFREKLEKEFGISSFEGMVAAFCGRTALTPDEEERVRQLLKELRDDV